MGIVFWVKRFCPAFAIAFGVIVGSQLIRGHSIEDSVIHGLLWSTISASIFIGASAYQSRRGQTCPSCGDSPQNGQSTEC